MRVEVRYNKGRFGNHALQSSCARLFALDQGLKLLTGFPGPDQEILPASPAEGGATCEAPPFVPGDGSIFRHEAQAAARCRR